MGLADEMDLGKMVMFWGMIARVKELKGNFEGEVKEGGGEQDECMTMRLGGQQLSVM